MREAITEGNSKQKAIWDKRQLVKKINLNSLYGAIQSGCRSILPAVLDKVLHYVEEQSVKHMSSQTNEIIAGDI